MASDFPEGQKKSFKFFTDSVIAWWINAFAAEGRDAYTLQIIRRDRHKRVLPGLSVLPKHAYFFLSWRVIQKPG